MELSRLVRVLRNEGLQASGPDANDVPDAASDCQQNTQADDGDLRWGNLRYDVEGMPRKSAYGMLELTHAQH